MHELIYDVDLPMALHRQQAHATTLTGLIILAFALWLGLEAPHGTMWGTDELLTAERTREMLVTGERLVVHYNFHRSFEKPPLQYWLTTLTLPRFDNRAVAVRFWPLLYGMLTAAALGWLVFLIKPEQPWLMPLAVGLLISCPLFSTEAARGLLDVGLAFFTVLTIAFAELARRNPRWWMAAAIACWLGSLQKMPVPFLIWILILTVRVTNRNERALLRAGTRWLVASLVVAVALTSIWPLLQLIKYEMPVFREFHEEVIVWLGPTQLGREPYLRILYAMSTHPGGICGFLSLIALVLILFSKNESLSIREIALVAFAFLILAIVFNFRHIRYAIPIVPSLCLLLAIVFHRFFKLSHPIRTVAGAFLAIVLIAGFVHAEIHMNKRRRNVEDERTIAEKLGELQQPGTNTVLIKAIIPGNDLLWDSFYLFHGNFRFPVKKLTSDELRAYPPPPPLIGACIERDFPVVEEVYPNAEIVLTRAQFICWRVTAR